MAFGKMVDMAVTPKEQGKDMSAVAYPSPPDSGQPIYPYGLSVSLCDDELDKLELDTDCEVGDLLDARCMMKVTSVSQNETTSGKRCRVELQIVMMGVENESEEEIPAPRRLRPLPYKT